jgi:hypothetical protein
LIGTPSPIFPKIDPVANKEIAASAAAEKPKSTTAKAPAIEIPESATLDDIAAMIVAKGGEIRDLKAKKVAKDELQPSVDALLALKER